MIEWIRNLDPDNNMWHRWFVIIFVFIIYPSIPIILTLFIIWLIRITGI